MLLTLSELDPGSSSRVLGTTSGMTEGGMLIILKLKRALLLIKGKRARLKLSLYTDRYLSVTFFTTRSCCSLEIVMFLNGKVFFSLLIVAVL